VVQEERTSKEVVAPTSGEWFSQFSKWLDKLTSWWAYILPVVIISGALACVYGMIIRALGGEATWVNLYLEQMVGATCFFGAAYAMMRLRHVRIEVLEHLMPGRTRVISQLWGFSLFLISMSFVTYCFIQYTIFSITGGLREQLILFPMSYILVPESIGLFLLDLQILKHLVTIAQRLKTEHESGRHIFQKPYFVIPVYAILCALSVYWFLIQPVAGAFAILFIFLFTGIPIAGVTACLTVTAMFVFGGLTYLTSLGQVFQTAISHYTWAPFPFFVLGGFLMGAGLTRGLFRMLSAWLGWFKGGLPIAVIWFAVLVGAMLGSIWATLAIIFITGVAELERRNYDKGLTLPMVSSAATLAYLIPPSILLVIYGSLVQESIGALFMAGVGPGIVLALVFTIWVGIASARGKGEVYKATWRERFASIPPNVFALLIPIIVIGGITAGIGTPTEVSAVFLVYVLILALAQRQIKFSWKDWQPIFSESMQTMGFISLLLICALATGTALVAYKVGDTLSAWVLESGLGRHGTFGVLTLLLFLLGMIGEMFPVIVILIPTVFPVLYSLGLHPWWLCVYLVLMGGIGGITPPVGGTLFVVAGMAKVEPYFVFRRIIPWVACFLVVVLIIYLWPDLVTFLPYATGYSPPLGFEK